MLIREWQAELDLDWPYQPCPLKLFWGFFGRFLRLTVCQRTSLTQLADYATGLAIPLGTWHNVDRHAWFDCYRTQEVIYCRDEDGKKFHIFCKSGSSFCSHKETVGKLPRRIHRIACQKVGQSYWTHRMLRLTKIMNQ